MTRNALPIISAVLIVISAGCADTPITAPETSAVHGSRSSIGTDEPDDTDVTPGVAAVAPSADRPARRAQQILELGTDEYIRAHKTEPATNRSAGDITLNFDNVALDEFVRAVLGELLGETYVMDDNVQGNVTLHTARGLTRDGVLELLHDVLAMHDATLVRAGDIFKVLPLAAALSNSVVSTQPGSDGYSVRVIQLQYIAASEMQKILEPFLDDPGALRIDERRNLLIAGGAPSKLRTITDTVAMFDVDWLRGVSVGFYPLNYVDPVTIADELDAISNGIQGGESTDPFDGMARVVPVERLNSIILIGKTARTLRELEIWLRRLDQPGEGTGQDLFVYEVQNAKAVELAAILEQIFNRRGREADGSATPLAPGLERATLGARDQTRNGGPSSIGIATLGDVEIIADDRRNSLVILASPDDYAMVSRALAKLDVVPLQVLIQASILEVTLRDDLAYGVEWFFKNGLQSGSSAKKGIGSLDLGGSGISALSPSFSYTIVDNVDQVRIALNALSNESEINILSSPSLMVLDNETATINVGDEIPVPTRQAVSTIDPDAPTVNEIQFRKTGIALSVTPRVNNSGLVTMEIDQEVSAAAATTSSEIDAPTIQNREISSTVAVNSGETIVLGGLIQDTQSESESGIPGLRRIPGLGKLFGQTSSENLRTELLIMITPKVVRRAQDARDVTEDLRRQLKGLSRREKAS